MRGCANHAGTTPQADRQDALVAAAHLILAVQAVMSREPGDQVGTVGHLVVSPNMVNVVPGLVRLTIDLRALSSQQLDVWMESIKKHAGEIAAQTRTEIAISQTLHSEGCKAAPEVQSAIETSATKLGLASRRLVSGAGHDAQSMARLGPVGMIFVPSAGGVSHSPKEFTDWDDCARGAEVLLETVLALAN
jgi:N-carbamoyl-L-amino-acid hydrolase